MVIRILLCGFLLGGALVADEPAPKETPTVIIVFGATGDLASKKIIPALSRLAEGQGGKPFAVIGVGRRDFTHEQLRGYFPAIGDKLRSRLFYTRVDLDRSDTFGNLKHSIEEIEGRFGAKANRLFFLATQASYFAPIVNEIEKQGLLHPLEGKEWSRVMVEKPFGRDLSSAVELQKSLEKTLDESQLYRIDHYLGKPGVEGLAAFRQEGKFEAVWNREHIDHIQISFSEKIGIGTRAQFWEETGLLRDVFQNHLMQLLAFTASDLPLDPSSKIRVLNAVRPAEKKVLGQYGPGNGAAGYADEPGVPENSQAETFAAGQFWIDNERWKGVPFYIRAGKRMAEQTVLITAVFKDGNQLSFRIQPEPAVFLGKEKIASFPDGPESYETLFADCLRGDQSRFVSKEEHFAAWRIIAPLIESNEPLRLYPSGTTGPAEADRLISEDGREWLDLVF